MNLFSSQSIKPEVTVNEEEDGDDKMVGFLELEFNTEEENVDDNVIVFGNS